MGKGAGQIGEVQAENNEGWWKQTGKKEVLNYKISLQIPIILLNCLLKHFETELLTQELWLYWRYHWLWLYWRYHCHCVEYFEKQTETGITRV